jgi:hypothetical protein
MPEPVYFPDSLATEQFQIAWLEWVIHRDQIKKPMTPLAAQKLLKKLEEWGPERAIAAIEFSITMGYRGIFESQGQAKKVDQFASLKEFVEDKPDDPPF